MRWGSGQGTIVWRWRVWGWVGRDSDRLSCAARTPPAGCCARLSPDQRKMAAVYSFQFSCPDTEEDSAAVMGTGLGRLQTGSQGILVTFGQVGGTGGCLGTDFYCVILQPEVYFWVWTFHMTQILLWVPISWHVVNWSSWACYQLASIQSVLRSHIWECSLENKFWEVEK